MSPKNVKTWLKIMRSNILEMTGNTFTGLWLFLEVRAFFLKFGALNVNFKKSGNLVLFKESLKGRNSKIEGRNLLKLR